MFLVNIGWKVFVEEIIPHSTWPVLVTMTTIGLQRETDLGVITVNMRSFVTVHSLTGTGTV